MKLKSVFLGENGLTTTSAQHIKDMAGHYVDNLKQKLNFIIFVNINISIILFLLLLVVFIYLL